METNKNLLKKDLSQKKVDLKALLNNVKSGERIPALDVDNTLTIPNGGFNIFEFIFRNNKDKYEDRLSRPCASDLLVEYFTLNLKQIALNYPNYTTIIKELQKSIENIKNHNNEDALFSALVSTLRNKVISLRGKKKIFQMIFL